ncbi:MAG: hypothetical protein RLY59_44 [Actinomycetota bacterium]|jgi:antibiotic biosynthesis monooxygenase (ABM) superfamily enzyme
MAHPQKPVSVHIRALATWLVIFPLVAVGLTILGPLLGNVHPILKAFVLTIIVVPLAVYLLVPNLLALFERLSEKKTAAKQKN